MDDHGRAIQDLQADVAILGWLIERLIAELGARSTQDSEQPSISAQHLAPEAEASLQSAEHLLRAIRMRAVAIDPNARHAPAPVSVPLDELPLVAMDAMRPSQ